MYCPKCGNDKFKVISVKKDEFNLRELFCQTCGLLIKSKEELVEVKSFATRKYISVEEWKKWEKLKNHG